MCEVIHTVTNDWGCEVIGFTTDSSGDACKACKLLNLEMPELATPPCYVHQVWFLVTLMTHRANYQWNQVSLVTGDYFKSNADFFPAAEKADKIISWL